MMPSFAYVEANLRCPVCDEFIERLLGFHWGYCPGLVPREEFIYQIGEKIKWKKCRDGTILSWTYFGDSEGNIGDPKIKNIVILDTTVYFQGHLACPNCKLEIGGAAVKILDGIIEETWIFEQGEFDDGESYYFIQEDGSLLPSGWDGRPMDIVDDGC